MQFLFINVVMYYIKCDTHAEIQNPSLTFSKNLLRRLTHIRDETPASPRAMKVVLRKSASSANPSASGYPWILESTASQFS